MEEYRKKLERIERGELYSFASDVMSWAGVGTASSANDANEIEGAKSDDDGDDGDGGKRGGRAVTAQDTGGTFLPILMAPFEFVNELISGSESKPVVKGQAQLTREGASQVGSKAERARDRSRRLNIARQLEGWLSSKAMAEYLQNAALPGIGGVLSESQVKLLSAFRDLWHVIFFSSYF